MRSALLLAALVLPALASAQAEGVVVNGTSQSSTEIVADDQYINLDECIGAADTGVGPLELLWRVKLATGGVLNGGAFRLYATNDAGAPGTTEPRYCKTQDDPNASPAVYADQIGGDVTATVGQPTENEEVPTAEIVLAATEATFTCDETLPDRTITICAHYHAAVTGGGVASTPTGWAVGQLTLSLRRPPPPPSTGMSVRGGEQALEVSWSAAPAPGSNQATATGYRVVVRNAASGTAVTFKDVTDKRARVEGLVNGTLYTVDVYSLSAAKNMSPTAVSAEGTPVPTADFWEFYRSAGGVEQGGCAGGPAGPLALLAVAGLLAALRRRA